jgi:hypothetical protein
MEPCFCPHTELSIADPPRHRRIPPCGLPLTFALVFTSPSGELLTRDAGPLRGRTLREPATGHHMAAPKGQLPHRFPGGLVYNLFGANHSAHDLVLSFFDSLKPRALARG